MDSTLQISSYIQNRIIAGADDAQVDRIIKWYLDDVFKLIKNINETSTSDSDKQIRIKELQSKYGIPVQHLLNQ
jgi:hypothetical protein